MWQKDRFFLPLQPMWTYTEAETLVFVSGGRNAIN